MSKSILVIDTPESCEKCPLCYDDVNCALNGWVVFSDSGHINRDKDCPLKPLGQELDKYDLEVLNGRRKSILCEKGLFEKIYEDKEDIE